MAEKILFSAYHNMPTSKTLSELSCMIFSMTDHYLRIGKWIDAENSLLLCMDIIETCDCFETIAKKERMICECRLRLGEIYAAEGHTAASDTIREAVSTCNNPTPDEFVYVTYKEDRLAGRVESHKYQFAYG